jgi:epoxyqueuosine reductase
MEANQVKEIVYSLGADLCGIASTERFTKAPEGFRPTDIYSSCKSVVVFAKRLPTEAIFATSCVPYTYINNILTNEVDKMGVELALCLEKQGVKAVPIPSDDPYEHWEPERSYGRAILSLKHAAYLAGLGVIGKNTLLVNKDYGNMIQIGAVLVNCEIDPDSLATYTGCVTGCNKCIDLCPQRALNGLTVEQEKCRPLSNYKNEKGYILKKCSLCRKVCPNCLGISDGGIV